MFNVFEREGERSVPCIHTPNATTAWAEPGLNQDPGTKYSSPTCVI